MRSQAIHAICHEFDKWAAAHPELQPACGKQCSSCCTENVTITAMEGETILDYVIEDTRRIEWFAAVLETTLIKRCGIPAPSYSTNEFAKACLAGEEVAQKPPLASSRCPFLQDDLCAIYPVRPFGCSSFLSMHKCSVNSPAAIPDFYLDAATACSQLIEHLGQKEYWGNLYDVLAALLDIRKYRKIAELIEHNSQGLLLQAKMRVLAAAPLPGFLIEEHSFNKVEPLFTAIFTHTISGKTVEDILNGQQ